MLDNIPRDQLHTTQGIAFKITNIEGFKQNQIYTSGMIIKPTLLKNLFDNQIRCSNVQFESTSTPTTVEI